MPYCSVLLPVPYLEEALIYSSDISILPGTLVTIPLRGQTMMGVVWETQHNSVPSLNLEKVKPILSFCEGVPFSQLHRQFLTWVAQYTLAPLGAVLKLSLPSLKVAEAGQMSKKPRKKVKDLPSLEGSKAALTDHQHKAAQTLRAFIREKLFNVCFLDGVTGSGKTEVYFEALEEITCQSSAQALVLLPEISLTHQMIDRFYKRFPHKRIEVWHSSLSPTMRGRLWHEVARGKIDMIIGARSALFLPFRHLQGIVVDEEHDPSFKQEEGVLYHARDMAIVRAKLGHFPIILSSATPSLETFIHVQNKKYARVHLPVRYGAPRLPQSHVIDMRRENMAKNRFLSPTLLKKMTETLEKGKQVMLFINRRGWAPLTLCQHCGCRLSCLHCTSWLVEHKRYQRFLCHYCGYSLNKTDLCPACHQKSSWLSCGPGIERIEHEVRSHFPEKKLAALSSDSMRRKEQKDILTSIERGEVDIILGTQIIAKGLHFPHLHCVGIIDAEAGLSLEDFRAPERCFQLLHQVSGRAGREKEEGVVFLQTYNPQADVIQALLKQAIEPFMQLQAEKRQLLNFPPFGKMASLILAGEDEEAVRTWCYTLSRHIPPWEGVHVLGPVPAVLTRLRGKTRWRFLIKTKKDVIIQTFIKRWLAHQKTPSSLQVTIDIDPYSFI